MASSTILLGSSNPYVNQCSAQIGLSHTQGIGPHYQVGYQIRRVRPRLPPMLDHQRTSLGKVFGQGPQGDHLAKEISKQIQSSPLPKGNPPNCWKVYVDGVSRSGGGRARVLLVSTKVMSSPTLFALPSVPQTTVHNMKP